LKDVPIERGSKFDTGKPELFLNPPEIQKGMARAFGFGAEKYGTWNWMGGLKVSRLFSATMRHLLAWFWEGTPDDDSGLSHLDHAAASLAMLMDTVKRKPELDDRPCAVGLDSVDGAPKPQTRPPEPQPVQGLLFGADKVVSGTWQTETPSGYTTISY
jgi:hypothetical protein